MKLLNELWAIDEFKMLVLLVVVIGSLALESYWMAA